jgi:hypothetical protein
VSVRLTAAAFQVVHGRSATDVLRLRAAIAGAVGDALFDHLLDSALDDCALAQLILRRTVGVNGLLRDRTRELAGKSPDLGRARRRRRRAGYAT